MILILATIAVMEFGLMVWLVRVLFDKAVLEDAPANRGTYNCSKCFREVHRVRGPWTHSNDRSALCSGGIALRSHPFRREKIWKKEFR